MLALLKRDLKLAIRAGGGFGLAIGFFLIICVLVPFGVGPQTQTLRPVAPGILWVGALLASLLSLDRVFALDYEDGSLDLLVTAPIPLEAVALVKATAHWLTTGLPIAMLAPFFGLLLQLPPASIPWLIVSLLIGTPALSMIGTFGAALTVGLRRGGLLLSILVLPLYIPTLIFGTELVRRGVQSGEAGAPILYLAAITAASIALLPFVSAAVLKINLR